VRYFIHVITGNERIRDPEGAVFASLATAREEACQSARDLMADELRAGRPLPLTWRVQIADAEECVLLTINFRSLVMEAGKDVQAAPSLQPELALLERARETFARARKSHAEIRFGLSELRDHVRRLSEYSTVLRVR